MCAELLGIVERLFDTMDSVTVDVHFYVLHMICFHGYNVCSDVYVEC